MAPEKKTPGDKASAPSTTTELWQINQGFGWWENSTWQLYHPNHM